MLAVFLSQPRDSSKKKGKQVVLHFDLSFCVPTLTTRNVNVRVLGRARFLAYMVWGIASCSVIRTIKYNDTCFETRRGRCRQLSSETRCKVPFSLTKSKVSTLNEYSHRFHLFFTTTLRPPKSFERLNS